MAKGKFVQSLVKAAEKAGLLDMSKQSTEAFPSLAKASSEIKSLAEKHGKVYVRWSPDASIDISGGRNSRDFVSGAQHNGLSAVEISNNDSREEIARSLAEYGFLRMQDANSKPKVYLAKRVGTDSDSHALIRPSKLLYDADDAVIKDIDLGAADAMRIEAEIADTMARIEKSDSTGKKILLESLNKKQNQYKDIVLKAMASSGVVGSGLASADTISKERKEPKGKFAKSLMDAYLKQQVAKPMSPDERLQYGQGFGTQDKIEPVQNEWAAKAAEYSDKYNKWRRENVHPIVDMALPVGELPADVLRKMSYGDKVKYMDSVMAGLGML